MPVETRASQLGSGIRFIRLDTGPCASHVLAITVVEQTDAGDHWVVTIRDNVPITGHPRRFMRLRVGR